MIVLNNYIALTEWYWAFINVLTALLFIYDKKVAGKKYKRRIPENILHLLETLGGIFSALILMYVLHHKNRKKSYWLMSWLIAIIWFIGLYLYIKNVANLRIST